MSRKAAPDPQERVPARPKHRKLDARSSRTRNRLGMAFIELIHEMPIEDVTVQDVLDRADVGRSTFYLHFRDKNDLLLSQLERFLEHMSTVLSVNKEKSLRVAPVTEMFDHLDQQRKLYGILRDAGRLTDRHQPRHNALGVAGHRVQHLAMNIGRNSAHIVMRGR